MIALPDAAPDREIERKGRVRGKDDRGRIGNTEEICDHAPRVVDGLCGKTDEDKYGFTYDELEKVARGNEKLVDGAKVRLIKSKLESMAFKRRLLNLPCFVPSDKNPKDW